MERKTADILLQYEKEVQHVRTMFEEQQDKPPLCKNQPPLAGAIGWSHSLFLRIRRSIAKFQSMEELLQSEQGKEVSKTFVSVSKAIRHYEQGKFEEWRETVNAKAMSLLKQPIFKAVKGGAEVPPERRDGTETTLVNFDSELTTLIRESKYLDRMGFAVPETALNVTLQEDKYHGYVEALKAMLAAHAQISESLSSVEVQLLQPRIAELRTCLDKGFTLLNWNSLSIPEFTMSCTKAINKFNGLVKQIQKNASIIKGVVDKISTAELVSKPSAANSDVPELSELYEESERVRTTTLEGLVRQYHQIGPLLIKQEEMVVSSNTGRSPQLRKYYAHWEAQIFGALQAMVSKALTQCLHLLSPKGTNAKGGAGRPLFRVGAILSAPEVLVSPPLAEVNKFLSRMVKALVQCCHYHPLLYCTLLPCHAFPLTPPHTPLYPLTHPQVECCRSFVRWMDGTCIETPPQFVSEDEDPVVFSFFSDLERSPDVARLTLTVTRAIEKTFGRVNKQLDQYRRYDQLWKVDKAQHLSKFEQRNPTTVMFDSRLQSFSKAVQDARAMPHELEVRLHASTL